MGKDVDLTGWKFELEMRPGFKVMWQNQYRAYITDPRGNPVGTLLSLRSVSVYAWTDKGAERKVIRKIRNFVRDEQRAAVAKRSVSL